MKLVSIVSHQPFHPMGCMCLQCVDSKRTKQSVVDSAPVTDHATDALVSLQEVLTDGHTRAAQERVNYSVGEDWNDD